MVVRARSRLSAPPPQCCTSTCQSSLEAESQPPRWWSRMRSKGPEAALWGCSTLQPTRVWASSVEDSEEGQKRAGYFFSPNFIYLPLFYVFCLHVCLCGSVKSWSYRQLWAAMWVLRFEPGSSEKEVSVPNLWAISPAPGAGSFKQRYYKVEMFTALGPRAKSSAWFWLSSGSWWELWSGSYKQW